MKTTDSFRAAMLLWKQYGLLIATLAPLTTTGGPIKSLFAVETPSDRLFFKRYRRDFRSPTDLKAMNDATSHLARLHLPMPVVIPNLAGTNVTTADDDTWVLTRRAPGTHPEPGAIDPVAAAAIGSLLGRVAQGLHGWQTDWTGAEPLQVNPLAEHIPLLERLLRSAEQGSGAGDRLACRVLRHRIAALERMAHWERPLLTMEQQWVHGDPNEGNILLDPSGGVTGLIDWDNMRRAPRGFDFMYTLNSCFRAAGPDRNAFARAYLRIVNPTEGELALFVPLRRYWELCDIWPLDEIYLRQASPPVHNDGPVIDEPSDWWEHQLEPLTQWLLDTNRSIRNEEAYPWN